MKKQRPGRNVAPFRIRYSDDLRYPYRALFIGDILVISPRFYDKRKALMFGLACWFRKVDAVLTEEGVRKVA